MRHTNVLPILKWVFLPFCFYGNYAKKHAEKESTYRIRQVIVMLLKSSLRYLFGTAEGSIPAYSDYGSGENMRVLP
jgi:hypothetical protein